ncbi:MAG: FHA domain-containing protein, partial [Archangium sp.]|nr:FHA domain-containing protein [Archangium sp.]
MAVPLTLKVFKGDQLVSSKDYDRDIIKIGRLTSAHLCLDDEKVSRIHSVIEVAPDGSLSIIDMGSVEGTFVNGKRVNKGALAFGDEIKVGATKIKVEKAEAPAGAVAIAPVAPVIAAPPPPPAAAFVPPPAPVEARSAVVPPPPPVVNEQTGEPVRAKPRRRKGTGPLGVEVRFMWGDRMVGEYFLHPGVERTFTVGSADGVDFEMGDTKLGKPKFNLISFGKDGAKLFFTKSMK